jgi:type II secretory pathway pseudopilin PulG
MRRRIVQRGVTLIELAAASAFLATALLGAVAAITSSSALALETQETRVAKRAAASLMEDIRATAFDDLVDTFHGSAYPVMSPSGTAGSADVAVQQVVNSTAPWTVYEVLVMVRWARPDTPRVVAMRTYVSDRVRGSGIAVKTVLEAN